MIVKQGVRPYISMVIPVYNEEANVEVLAKELKRVLDDMGKFFEIIFVDDGSTDSTLARLLMLRKDIPELKVIELMKNSGQTAATLAGFRNSSGDIIVTMDGDLQHYPEDIPRIVKMVEDGYDCVGSWRYDRKNERFGKRIPSKISNFLAYHLTGTHIHDFGSGFKAYRKECVDGLILYGSFHRYIPALVKDKGFKVGEIRIQWRERYGGKTKYGSSRLVKGMRDLIFISLSTRFKGLPLARFITRLMLKVNYDGGRPIYRIKKKYGFD